MPLIICFFLIRFIMISETYSCTILSLLVFINSNKQLIILAVMQMIVAIIRWKTLNYNYYEILYHMKQTLNNKTKRLSYHKNINIDYNDKIIPETTNDLIKQAQYLGDAREKRFGLIL